ncbi:hypothetical protein ACFQ3Z_38050 [Streptomyces nogalater]
MPSEGTTHHHTAASSASWILEQLQVQAGAQGLITWGVSVTGCSVPWAWSPSARPTGRSPKRRAVRASSWTTNVTRRPGIGVNLTSRASATERGTWPGG